MPATDFTKVSEQLCAIVCAHNVLTTPSSMEGYVKDWTGQYRSDALAIVRPVSTQDVSDIVKICIAHHISIVPQGGQKGLCGGGVTIEGHQSIILSLTRMNTIRSIDVNGRTLIAEAGVVLETLHQKSLEHGLIFPLVFGAKGSCTIGGNLSTNAGGSNVVRYGNTRELCIGIEAVMPDGSIINALTGLRKDNTGYDLKNLMIGAEGTLGIITAAVFKLSPVQTSRATAFLSLSSLDVAVDVLNRLQDQTGGGVEAFEYMPREAVDVICNQFPHIRQPLDEPAKTGILLEVASSRPFDAEQLDDGSIRLEDQVVQVLGELMEQELVIDAMVTRSVQQRRDLWEMRESILEAITQNGPAYHFDISLPLAQIASFVDQMNSEAAMHGYLPLTVGHLGDGNLHYALSAKGNERWDSLPLAAMKQFAFDLLIELKGSFSAEHGIGQSKLSIMTKLKEPA
jgi:FAD/FMN-containing dehydrogenase